MGVKRITTKVMPVRHRGTHDPTAAVMGSVRADYRPEVGITGLSTGLLVVVAPTAPDEIPNTGRSV